MVCNLTQPSSSDISNSWPVPMPSALRNPAGTTIRPAESTLTRRDPRSAPGVASGARIGRAGCPGVNLEYAMMFV